ncbi:MAG: DUF5680 domain-containing protein [Bacteroides sp.]|nr:DUF5680 domain-containing protein [Eubacterium sp.]MCM1418255.1 DUF5680 domain-containing protein [Roseburia sp.]MCM1462363.1 DUF5680 domain-containing protein [Bacteroides sp.]
MDNEIIEFLLKAKKATYAGGGVPTEPTRPGSVDFYFGEGELSYRDSYLGGERFIGEEALWRGGAPCWGMNYAGRVLDESFSGDFLKEALCNAPKEKPFRGPEYFASGDFAYRCGISGTFEWFQGFETVSFQDKPVYECRFHGGVVR